MKTLLFFILLGSIFQLSAQERIVKINFESNSFRNSPNIPFHEPFLIQGEVGADIEFVKIDIYNEGKKIALHTFVWNRCPSNDTETFNIAVPAILKSNSKYDFEITTYKKMDESQKEVLAAELEQRIRFYLQNNIYYDGKEVSFSKPKEVYGNLKNLIQESLVYHESKNSIIIHAPSNLVLDELEKQNDFKFKSFFRKNSKFERDSLAIELINTKIDYLLSVINSELKTYLSSQVVQHYRKAEIKSVPTDKEPFTLPINAGLYVWNISVAGNTSLLNTSITPGIGLTIPFNSKTKFASKHKSFDSFGLSIGVLLDQVRDAEANIYTTPWVNMPIYTGLGIRMFKVARVNAGVLVLGQKGVQDFNNFKIIPTVGLSFELNAWLGVKK